MHGMKTQVCVQRDQHQGKVPGPAGDKFQQWSGKREGPQNSKIFSYNIKETLICTIPIPILPQFLFPSHLHLHVTMLRS